MTDVYKQQTSEEGNKLSKNTQMARDEEEHMEDESEQTRKEGNKLSENSQMARDEEEEMEDESEQGQDESKNQSGGSHFDPLLPGRFSPCYCFARGE